MGKKEKRRNEVKGEMEEGEEGEEEEEGEGEIEGEGKEEVVTRGQTSYVPFCL